MKLRNGYVSNSSSSSFIASAEEAIRLLKEERKIKLKKIEKIVYSQDNVVSLHQEIIKNSNK